MTIAADIQSLSPTALIELYVLDLSLFGETPLYFHAGTNELSQPLTWQGQIYTPLPVESEGFDVSGKGVLPRPKIRVANVGGLFSAELRTNDDLVGCKVIRKRTFMKYLDAVNFPGGVNPDADPNQHLPDDLWYVDRKLTENRYVVEWELASAFDLQGVMLPGRQVIQNACPWKYRSAECGYAGGYFDANDQPTTNSSLDVCGKRLGSCKVRFVSGVIPFGGFPGAIRYD